MVSAINEKTSFIRAFICKPYLILFVLSHRAINITENPGLKARVKINDLTLLGDKNFSFVGQIQKIVNISSLLAAMRVTSPVFSCDVTGIYNRYLRHTKENLLHYLKKEEWKSWSRKNGSWKKFFFACVSLK